MNKETENEIAFGDNARPEGLNDIKGDDKRMSFTEDDLIEQLEHFASNVELDEEKSHEIQNEIDLVIDKYFGDNHEVAEKLAEIRDSIPCFCGGEQ